MWETDGEAAREEQGAGASAGERGVPRRLATWLKTGWELENFLPWVERPPLHFEGIRTNSRAQGEARSRKRHSYWRGFYGRVNAVQDM